MKKLLFLTILCLSAVGCFVPNPPNPGFRVETLIAVDQGFFPGFPVYIPAPKAGTVTDGDAFAYPPGAPAPTGFVERFRASISNGRGQFDVNNGKAPWLWRISAVSGWGDCNGLSNFFETEPGGTIEPTCYEDGGFLIFPLAPSSVDQYSQPVELQATIDNITTTNGMPIFHFEDYNGDLLATTTATQVNGFDVRINSSCLMDKPIGTYSIKVYNAPNPNSPPSKPVGVSRILVKEPPPLVCYPQPGGINQETCEGVYGRTWDSMTCSCMW